MKTAQDRANGAAYADGARCAKKGLGVTKSGGDDFVEMRRLFDIWRGLNHIKMVNPRALEESFWVWKDGWYDEMIRDDAVDERQRRAALYLGC